MRTFHQVRANRTVVLAWCGARLLAVILIKVTVDAQARDRRRSGARFHRLPGFAEDARRRR